MSDYRAVFLEELTKIAPDIDAATVSEDDHIQDDLELDSMDVLNLVAALHERLGVNIPESDYEEIASLRKAALYLSRQVIGRAE